MDIAQARFGKVKSGDSFGFDDPCRLTMEHEDLTEEFDALKPPEKAAQFRAQLAKTTQKASDPANRN